MKPAPPRPEPETPKGNRLNEAGDKKRVLRVWQAARVGPWQRQLQYMQFGADTLRPLIFLHSIEYPTCPSWGFCVDAADAGFGVIAIRRPGFGDSEKAGQVDEQTAVLEHFLNEADLSNAVLVGIGSACPAAYRLAATSPRIAYSVYVNCVFNRDVIGEFRPHWLGPIFVQALQNPAGARFSLEALRQIASRMGAKRFYETVAQKSPGDVSFVRAFAKDIEAAWAIGSSIDTATFQDEMRYSLGDDPFLTDGVFRKLRGMALSGTETTATWKQGFEAESKRVGIPFGYLPSGDLFAAYKSGDTLLELLRECA